ncbi:hypothetical protein BV20DRAFT_68783 [Pilatotrama ljubarskyi]|nr:hypothetical protein BV20DRAFT_68783 [Pilatotrama ljubarskyi]
MVSPSILRRSSEHTPASESGRRRVHSPTCRRGGDTSTVAHSAGPSEKHIDALKKGNNNIKLKAYFQQDRLAQLAPDEVDAALKHNINLKT